jgi:hypothetical protein
VNRKEENEVNNKNVLKNEQLGPNEQANEQEGPIDPLVPNQEL